METEIWKDIPGYEGEYQASTMGRIKSLTRKTYSKNWSTGKPFARTIPERILRQGAFVKPDMYRLFFAGAAMENQCID